MLISVAYRERKSVKTDAACEEAIWLANPLTVIVLFLCTLSPNQGVAVFGSSAVTVNKGWVYQGRAGGLSLLLCRPEEEVGWKDTPRDACENE